MQVTKCPNCAESLEVPDDLVGTKVKCPDCKKSFVAEVEEEEEIYTPRRRRGNNGVVIFSVLAVGALAFMTLIWAIVRDGRKREEARVGVESTYSTSRSADIGDAAVGGAYLGFICTGILIVVVVHVLILVWVVRDAKNRGLEAPVWAIVVLISGLLGLIVYASCRTPGPPVRCSNCGQRRLTYLKHCPNRGSRK